MCVCFYEDHCVFLKHFSREGRRLALLRSSSMWKSHVIIIIYGIRNFSKIKERLQNIPIPIIFSFVFSFEIPQWPSYIRGMQDNNTVELVSGGCYVFLGVSLFLSLRENRWEKSACRKVNNASFRQRECNRFFQLTKSLYRSLLMCGVSLSVPTKMKNRPSSMERLFSTIVFEAGILFSSFQFSLFHSIDFSLHCRGNTLVRFTLIYIRK